MWNSSSAEDKQPYEKKAAKLKEKYDKVNRLKSKLEWFRFNFIFYFEACNRVGFCVALKTHWLCFPQDIIAYRTKGKVDSEAAATADDDDEEEEEEDEGEEEEEEDEDDDE